MSDDLTAAGAALLDEARMLAESSDSWRGIDSKWLVKVLEKRIPAIEAEAAARAVDEALSVLGEHEGNGCCDPKTLEHIAQSIRGRS